MISLWLKHYIVDMFLNSIFDGLLNTFGEKNIYKVGDKFNTIVNIPFSDAQCIGNTVFYNVTVVGISDTMMFGTYEKYIKYIKFHDVAMYKNSLWRRTGYRDMCEFNDHTNTIKITDISNNNIIVTFRYDNIDYTT